MDYNANADSRTPGRRTGLRAGAGVAAGAMLLAGAVAGWSVGQAGAGNVSASPVNPPAVERTIGGSVDSYAEVVDQIAPAVVTIRSERRVRNVSQNMPQIPEEFRDFFDFGRPGQRGQRQLPERREGGLGSGVIVRADGYILTNHHVIDGAEVVTVEFTDGRSLKAKVVGSDAPSDLAVLKVDGTNLQTLTLGDSDAVRVGDVVLAVGNPLGVGQTVTMGIVSAKGRATGGAGDGSFEDFIQTDAPINQGNSGGALVSTRGQLIGINSQILSRTGGNIGIGFAIPANMARNVMTQLIDSGQVRRGMLGVTIQPVTSDIARSLGLSAVRGALVNAVTAGGAAEDAGVRRGDVITAINGNSVKDGNELRNQVAQTAPGSKVSLTVLRDGKERTIDVTLAELKADSAGRDSREPGADATGFGMTVEPLPAARARELGVKGVVITGVQPGSRAAEAGLRAGDVIEQVDGQPVPTGDALSAALKSGERPALLLVHRGGTSIFVTIERTAK